MPLCIASILLLILGGLSLFAKDIMWELTQWNNKRNGVASERTESWETWTTVGGAIYVILALVAAYAFFRSGS